MKTFEYNQWLLCKDLFDCTNCPHYKQFLNSSSMPKFVLLTTFPGSDIINRPLRLSDYKVCRRFFPHLVLTKLNYDE